MWQRSPYSLCACVLVAQSCPAFCNPMDCSNPPPPRRLCPWDSSGKSTGVDCLSLLQGNLPNPGMEHWSPALQNLHSQILHRLVRSHQGGPVPCGGPLRNSQSQAELTETRGAGSGHRVQRETVCKGDSRVCEKSSDGSGCLGLASGGFMSAGWELGEEAPPRFTYPCTGHLYSVPLAGTLLKDH